MVEVGSPSESSVQLYRATRLHGVTLHEIELFRVHEEEHFLWNPHHTLDNGTCSLVLKYVGQIRAAKRNGCVSRRTV